MDTQITELSDDTVERVDRSRLRALLAAAPRELATELAVASLYVVVAAVLLVTGAGFTRVGLAVGLAALYTVLFHVEFEVGEGHTAPLQLALVPALVLLPAAEVPVIVGAAHLLASLIKVLRGLARPSRLFVSLANGAYCLAPAVLFAALGPAHGALAIAALVAGGLIAQITSDLAFTAIRLRLGLGLDPREELRGFVWVYLTDVSLAPIGYLAALAGHRDPGLVVLVLPLAGLLAVFARERRGRIGNALELKRLAEEEHERLQRIVQHSSDLIAILDADGVVRTATGLTAPVFGDNRGAGRGETLLDRVHPDDRAGVAALLAVLAGRAPGESQEGTWRILYADGSYRQTETVLTNLLQDATVRGIVLTAHDVEARIAFEEQLRHRAFHDALTGLANRALFFDRIEHSLARRDRRTAVLFIDLDNFKTLNDERGHTVGDEMLTEVAARLVGCLRSEDTAARLGGDEFGVLIENVEDEREVLATATRILESLDRPHRASSVRAHLSASIGVAVAEIGERGVEELLRKADLAMYRAKLGGRGRLEVYSPEHEAGPGNSTGRAAWFARADEQREEVVGLLEDPDAITTVMQPIMDLRTGLVAGYEALMRVERMPRRGPDLWLAQAHRSGLGYALEARAITTALAVPDRPAGRYLALNMSPSSLGSDEVLRALPEELSGIVIEITENELVSDDPALHDALTTLRLRGARIAVDDTGAGYAGLTHVVRLRPDIIKLDRALTVDVDSDPAKAALVASFVRYAEEIDAVVCAEGIETLSELERLADLDVAFGQGYGIARPQAPWAKPAETARDACRRAFAVTFTQGHRTTGSGPVRQLEQLARRLSDVDSAHGLTDVLPYIARALQADVASIDAPLPPRHANGWLVVDEPGAEPVVVERLRAGGFHSSLALPIAQRGSVLGSLTLARFSERPWSRSEISRARLVSPQLATALARAEAAPVAVSASPT